MESTFNSHQMGSVLCEEKTSQVMRWISEAEHGEKAEFAVARLFENGVLGENTKAFLHVLLEKEFPEDRIALELPPEKIRVLLAEAFTGTQLYLESPQTFLANFLTFRTDMLMVNSEMLSRLAYIVDYPYFPEMIDEWLAIGMQQGKKEITKSEFQEFLSHVDRAIILYSELDELQKFLDPIYDFHGAKLLSHEVIKKLFADKKLSVPPELDRDEYTSEDLAFALKDAVLSLPLDEPGIDLAPIPEYDSFLKELREIGVILPPPHLDLNENTKSLPPIEMFITKKLRNKCLEKIFHDNRNEYNRMIALLNATEDYAQAELNLQTLIGIHKVKPDSKTASRLRDALRMRFSREVEITSV
jgi:hypothetical protein